MPSIPLYPLDPSAAPNPTVSAFPQLLQTPSGLAIVELQGKLHLPEKEGETYIGEFIFDAHDQNRCWLYIGTHQRLRGEVKKLPVPLGVLRRRKKDGEDAKRQGGDEITGNEEVEIAEIIHYKLLFGSRPEPVTEGGVR